jgi:SWI/SNF-related matrix-associated actin-dependent regulator of chromatin subfamily A-like protein 1
LSYLLINIFLIVIFIKNKILEVTPSLIEHKALSLLDSYSGANNHILYLKTKKETSKKFYPTRTQSDYIINYFDTVPKVARKWVDLDTYFAKKFAEERYLMETPEKIYIEKLLVEKEKSYHIWGKFFEKDPLTEFWVPKSSLIKTHNVEKVDVDYSKYDHRPPLEHQKEAVEKLAGSRRFILADDMGLGKTTATIIAALETGSKKILIICPASLKINWQREIENYSDRPVYIAEGKKFSTESDFVIVNYDILKNFHDTDPKKKNESILNQSNFDLVILDEAHMISNPQAQRTKIINHFVKDIKRVWLLTGTPMTSRPMNYYNLLNIIESPVAQNWMAYAIRYCQGYQFMAGRRKVWNVTGASNLEELRDRTSKQILRRLKEDVLDLPDKIISPVYLRLKSKEYEELMGEYYDWFDNKKDESSSLTVQFSKLMKVRKVIANEKTKQTIEFAENIIEQGKKVIIFTNFTDTLQTIYQHFGKQAVYLDGSCSKPHRQNAVDEFQENDKIKVFVGNLKAAGVGLTLTAAEVVIMNDLSFVPAEHAQAEDRAYRYGQKSNVLVYYPLYENTIEGAVYDILNRKKEIIRTVMGDQQPENVGDVVEEILGLINKRR